MVVLGRPDSLVDVSIAREDQKYCRFGHSHCQFYFDVVEHMRQIDVEAIDLVSHHCSGCADGHVIGVLDQLDVQRRCWKIVQIVIEERWRLYSALYHYCFHLSVLRLSLPKMNFGSSVLYIVVESATDCCRNVGVIDTIEQLLMVHIVECSSQIERDEYCSMSRNFS